MSIPRHTKIVATLGPASHLEAAILSLARAGVDVFRLNFSHGTLAEHRARYLHVRAAEATLGRPLAVLADLQGPKIRVGRFAEGPVRLEAGASFRLDLDPAPGDVRRVALPHPEVLASLRAGDVLLLDDGRLRLRVRLARTDAADCLVESGGLLSDRKGVNLPQTLLQSSVMTPKDRDDLGVALALGVDWVALSFVQTAADVEELRDQIRGRARIIAKIEKPQAIENLEAIAQAADALMVARGDLAVEASCEDVPVLQRRVVAVARRLGRPVVVATQMLESMTAAPVPTRAEASDVATAVYQGADAVMLSAETASGAHGLEAVEVMDRIIRRVESEPATAGIAHDMPPAHDGSSAAAGGDVIGGALRAVSGSTTLACTVTYTTSGASALKVARERPRCPLIAVTPTVEVARALGLVWGVLPLVSSRAQGIDDMLQVAQEAAYARLPSSRDRPVAVVGGLPFGTPGATNFLHVVPAPDAASARSE